MTILYANQRVIIIIIEANILIIDENFIKICDFTTAKKFKEGQKFYDIAGTAGFRGLLIFN